MFRGLRSTTRQDSTPHTFVVYAAVVAVVAAALVALVPWTREWHVGHPAMFAVLSGFVLAGELLPIPVPRRRGLARVTISTAFAFAILLRCGPGPAALIYVASSVIADLAGRLAPLKILFNAAQYLLAVLAAGAVLLIAQSLPLSSITGDELPIVLLAALAFFAVNHVLACIACALLARLPIVAYLREDLAFQAWTAGCVLAFAPALLASADASVALVPVCFVPMLAVYVGGRQAAMSSHRAHHDGLTGLPNRSSLAETLQEALDGAASEAARGDRDAARPRRLQADQRRARPRGGRPGDPAGRAAARPRCRGRRAGHGPGADRWRRVRSARARLAGRRRAGGRAAAGRARSSARGRLGGASPAREHRDRLLPRPRPHRTRADAPRRRGDVLRQGHGRGVRHLRQGRRRVQHRPARAGRPAAAGDRARGVGRPLPAQGPAQRRRDAGGRGAGALEPSPARVHRPRRVHPAGRADRRDQAAHREGPGGLARAVPPLAPGRARGRRCPSTCPPAACSTTTCR